MKIGFLGAYSIENAGDQLLGYAVRQSFRALLPDAEQIVFAPELRGGFWRHAWNESRGTGAVVTRIPADDSVKWAKGLDAVVIGGGGILRLEPDFRPFQLGDPRKWPRDVPAAWNAIGAEATPSRLAGHEEDYARIARCCETLKYVSVRNELTARFVKTCGFGGEVNVVPDPTLSMELPEDDTAERILRAAGVDTSAFVVGLSVGTALRDVRAQHFFKELLDTLARLVAKRAVEVVVFPFGEIYGDAELARAAHGAIPGSKLVTESLGALDRWRLVGALDFYVCARWHAVLAAFAQDVPFLAMDEYLSDLTASSKIRELIVDTGLEALYLAPCISMHPAAKLENALALADDLAFTEQRAKMQARLHAHYAAMVRSLA